MEFNLEQIKNLIYVANCFENWSKGGKVESIKITEGIPINLWNLFKIYLYRFCDTRTVLILPPVKKIPTGFLYGSFKHVKVSEKTEFVCEGAFSNANIIDLKIPSNTVVQSGALNKNPVFGNGSKEISLLSIEKEEMCLFLGKVKALAGFEAGTQITSLNQLVDECNKKNCLKGKITLSSKSELSSQVYSFERELRRFIVTSKISYTAVNIGERLLIINMGLKVLKEKAGCTKKYECYAFLFENNDEYLFACIPLGIAASFTKNQLNQLPPILEKLVEKMSS